MLKGIRAIESYRAKVRGWMRKAIQPAKVVSSLLLARNALNGNGIFISDRARQGHCHIIGGTGTGKSRLLQHMICEDIKAGRSVVLLDPHGDLYVACLRFVVSHHLEARTILIDPNDEDWAVGLNFLEHNGMRNSSAHASEVMKGIGKAFGGEDTEEMPRLQRWQRAALIPMVERRLTLVELADFVDPANPVLRKRVLQESTNYFIKQEWETFDSARPQDRYNLIEAVQNRAGKFAVSETVRRIFGQEKSTIDFRQEMDDPRGKIILCNLACTKMSKEEQKLLGVTILDKIVQAGMSRSNIPESQRRPVFVYLDEFGSFVSDDIARALQELRKFKVYMTLAHQELEQLKTENRKVYSAVMSEPQIKVAFRVSREDAEVMAKEIFAGQIRGDRVKRVIDTTRERHIETIRKVQNQGHSYSDNESETIGESEAETYGQSQGKSSGETIGEMNGRTDTEGVVETDGETWGDSVGQSVGENTTFLSGTSSGQMFYGDGELGIFEIPEPAMTTQGMHDSSGFGSSRANIQMSSSGGQHSTSYIDSHSTSHLESISHSQGQNESTSQARTQGSNKAQTHGHAHGVVTSESIVPFHEIQEYQELSQIQDYSIEEMMEKFIAWINTQPIRRAQLKVGNKRAVPIVTPLVEDKPFRQKDVEELKRRVYAQYARPAKDVDKEIEERREKWLNISEEERAALFPTKGKRKRAKKVAIPQAASNSKRPNPYDQK